MAAIGTIRKYSGIAVAAIGISIFAFIISDAFRTDRRLFGNNKNDIGVIGGKSIAYQDFHTKVEAMVEKVKEQQQMENIDEKTRSQIRDQIWQSLIDELVYEKEYLSTGLVVSSDELTYMVTGPEPHPSVKQAFTDPKTGIFDKSQLVNFLKNMDKDQKYKNMWLDFEDNLEKERLKQKYNNLVKASVFVTDVEANDEYYSKNKFASYRYVAIPIKSIADSTIKPSQKELEKYWKEHRFQYEVDESRSLDYVTFDIIPTKDDTAEIWNQMVIMRKELTETPNDSSYIQVNSEVPFDTNFHPRGFFAKNIEDSLLVAGKKISGPYFDGNAYKIAKMVSQKNDTVFFYRASHILFKPVGATDKDTLDAMKKARDMMAEIRRGADFAKKASEFSDDKGTAVNGGDVNWFKEGAMVKPFMNAVKAGRKGDLIVVKTQYGAHLIKITEDKTNKIYKIGIIQKTIGPSSKTYNTAYYAANKFRGSVNSYGDFEKITREKGINKKIAADIKPEATEIPGIPESRKLVNWAYKVKVKDVSEVIEIGNQFVIAVLTKAHKKGPAPLEDVLADVTKKVIDQKKLEILYTKMQAAREKYNDIQKIADDLKLKVEDITNSSFGVPFMANIGEEKYVTGYIFGSEAGKLSAVVKGDNAVFVFIINSFSKVEAPKDLRSQRQEILQNYQGMSQYYATESVKESAKIKDLRYKFY